MKNEKDVTLNLETLETPFMGDPGTGSSALLKELDKPLILKDIEEEYTSSVLESNNKTLIAMNRTLKQKVKFNEGIARDLRINLLISILINTVLISVFLRRR